MASQITRKPLPRSAAYLKVASTFPDEIEPANPGNALLNVPAPTAVGEHDATSSAAATPLQSDENIQAPSGISAMNHSDIEESSTLKHDTHSPSPIKYAKWGVHWQQPTYVLLCTLSAVALALGHHFYYASLSGTPAGSSRRQQWANAFGISFSYLVVHLLGITIAVTYSQYIWSIIRQRGYTLKALDDLFSMTSDPRGLLNLEILRYGRIAIPLGLIYWLMGIASVTPPGTLSVVPGWHNQTMDISWISINWSLPGWLYDIYPSAELLEVGAFNINEVAPVTIPPPAPNSSYSLSFYGPSLQCNPANSTQQPFFDYYSEALFNESIWTKSLWLSNPSGQAGGPTDLATFLAFSAFSPGEINWYSYISGNTDLLGPQSISNQQAVPDQYNNWIENTAVVLGPNFYESTDFGVTYDITTQQFWVLTTNTAIVCILGNASFEVNLEYVDGKQTISQTVEDFEPLYMQEGNFPPGESTRTYVGVFTAFTSMLSGNISLALSFGPGPSLLMLDEMTSKVLQSGLAACQDVAPTYWIDYWKKETFSTSDVSEVFNGPSWMCRNETLAPAMEDLFNNITISMLSLNVSGSTNQSVPVKYFPTRNIYHYSSLNLILSYGIAIAATLFCIAIGIYATASNGVSHSTAFSAIVATTRNTKLYGLSEGSSLGALPLDQEMSKVKLRFGELIGKGEDRRHVAFGFEEEVLGLRKGGMYT